MFLTLDKINQFMKTNFEIAFLHKKIHFVFLNV